LAAAVASLVAVPLAHGATLSVDDDGVDCPAAPYQSVQAAVTAAAAGDTIAICPGTYVEGTGAIASNALTITKSLTIKGAGADLVSIQPKNAGGQIAEGSPAIRNGLGDIVVARGFPEAPLTVNISGVTIDGAGVASEAGVLFLDAQGSIVRSRVTNIVTSEGDDAGSQIGGYRSTMPGYGIAQLTAAGTISPAAAPRPLLIDHTRVDKYNRIGILVDGATATSDTATLAPTGVVNRLSLVSSQVVGRTLCINYKATGNCSSVNLLTTGTLYGQDGVRVTAGSSAAVTSSLVSQNLVNGTLAPTRNSADNNANLSKGAGVRLVGAAASSIAKSNITDNAYGVFNIGLNQGTPVANTTFPVAAENNWWGLAYNLATNPGPAISPATNPLVPGNPVNGTAKPDGAGITSDAVDFYPFRAGPQGSPTTGEFPLANAPMPVVDLAPTVALTLSPSFKYYPGGTVTLKAAAGDDFGVKTVTFFDGASAVGTATNAPWSVDEAIPADGGCAPKTFTAVAADFLGQTSSSTVSIDGACEDETPAGSASGGGGGSSTGDTPAGGDTSAPSGSGSTPTVSLVSPPSTIGPNGKTVTANPASEAGVARVDVFLGTRLVCSSASEPYSCDVTPTGADVGNQTLRVVVTDNAGGTAETSSPVTIERFTSTGLKLTATSKKLNDGLARKTVKGTLGLPAGVTPAQGCANSTVTLVIKRGGKTIDNAQLKLSAKCGFSSSFKVKRKGKAFSASAKFAGNTVLLPTSNTRRFS
jgi:ribosomal protein L37E